MIIQILDDQLELVEQGLAQNDVLGPYVVLPVRDEVAEPEMLGHPGVFILGGHLDEAIGVLVRLGSQAALFLWPIPKAVAVE